jgi:hypothetical protein
MRVTGSGGWIGGRRHELRSEPRTRCDLGKCIAQLCGAHPQDPVTLHAIGSLR